MNISLIPLEKKYYKLVYRLVKDMVNKKNSVSMRKTPPFLKFIRRIKEDKKYIIKLGTEAIGFVSITASNEIGYHLFEKYWGNGYAKKAVKMMMLEQKRSWYSATINLNNKNSIHFAESLNFKPKAVIMQLENKS